MAIQAEDVLVRLKAIGDEAGIKRFQEAMKRATGETAKGLGDVEKSSERAGRAISNLGGSGPGHINRITHALGGATAAMHTLDEGAHHLASRFLGLAAVEETLRHSFLGFAETRDVMARMAIDAGRTTGEVRALLPWFQKLSHELGMSTRESIKGFNVLREYAGMTLEETKAHYEAIARGAKAMGIAPAELAKVNAGIINTFGISADRIEHLNDMMMRATKDYKLEAQTLIPSLGRIGDQAQRIGMTGEEGVAVTLSLIGKMKEMGATSEQAAMGVGQLYAKLADPSVSKALTNNENTLTNYFEGAKASGMGARETWEGLMALIDRRSRALGGEAGIMRLFGGGGRGAAGMALRALRRSFDDVFDGAQEVERASGDVGNAVTTLEEQPLHSIETLEAAFENLRDTIGETLAKLGADTGLIKFAKDLEKLGEEISRVTGLLETLKSWFDKTPLERIQQMQNAPGQPGAAQPGQPGVGSAVGGALGMSVRRGSWADSIWQFLDRNNPANAAPEATAPAAPAHHGPISGRRATGGPVTAGQRYLVGERGPELFTPGMSGGISAGSEREVSKNTTELAMLTDEIHILNDRLQELSDKGGFVGEPGSRAGGGGGEGGYAGPSREGTGGGADVAAPMGHLGDQTPPPPPPGERVPTSPAEAPTTVEDAIRGGFMKPLTVPARQTGGDVKPGRHYVTGERGAELFTTNKEGRIEPRDERAVRELRGVDPRLQEIMTSASRHLPEGYKVQVTSGHSPTHGSPGSQHRRHNAMDVQIIGPDGKAIRNRGPDTTGMYGYLGRAAYTEMLARYPELKGRLAWGGSFGTSGRNPREADLMHYDIGGERGRLAPHLSAMGPLTAGETQVAAGQPSGGSGAAGGGGGVLGTLRRHEERQDQIARSSMRDTVTAMKAGEIDRSSLAGQLDDRNVAMLAGLTKAEVGSVSGAKAERLLAGHMNRTLIEKNATLRNRVFNGYYPRSTTSRLGNVSQQEIDAFRQGTLRNVMAGGGGAYTHNASLGVGRRAYARYGGQWYGDPARGGELFYSKTGEQEKLDKFRLKSDRDSGVTASAVENLGPLGDARKNMGEADRAKDTSKEEGGALRGAPIQNLEGSKQFGKQSAADDESVGAAQAARAELEKPIKVNMDLGGATQFGRASMRREADREVREARWNSYSDIGAA